VAVTANLPQMPTRWLTVYRVWMTLVGALAAVAGGVMIFRPRSGGDLPAGLLAIALGIVLLSISVGLGLRRRWAWHVNYWGPRHRGPALAAGEVTEAAWERQPHSPTQPHGPSARRPQMRDLTARNPSPPNSRIDWRRSTG